MKTRQFFLISIFVAVGAIVLTHNTNHETAQSPAGNAFAKPKNVIEKKSAISLSKKSQKSEPPIIATSEIIPASTVQKAVDLETQRQDLLTRPGASQDLERFWNSTLADQELRRAARLALTHERSTSTSKDRKDDALLRIFSLELLGQELKRGQRVGFEEVASVLVAKKWNGQLNEPGRAQDLQDLLTLWIETEGKDNFVQNPERFFQTFFQGRKFTSAHAQLVMKAIFNVVGQTLMEPNFKKRLYPYFQRNS